MVRFVCVRNVKWIRFTTSMCREPVWSSDRPYERTSARVSRILHVNSPNTCAHTEKPSETNEWPNATLNRLLLSFAVHFSLLHLDRLSCALYIERVCVFVFVCRNSLSQSTKRPFIIIPTKCHSFHGWRSKSNLTNASSAYIQTQPTEME